jgi:hypothetical protein
MGVCRKGWQSQNEGADDWVSNKIVLVWWRCTGMLFFRSTICATLRPGPGWVQPLLIDGLPAKVMTIVVKMIRNGAKDLSSSRLLRNKLECRRRSYFGKASPSTRYPKQPRDARFQRNSMGRCMNGPSQYVGLQDSVEMEKSILRTGKVEGQ